MQSALNKFQLYVWGPHEMLTIQEHLARNRPGFRSARNAGLSDYQLTSLLFMTLRPEHARLENQLRNYDKGNFERCVEILTKRLSCNNVGNMRNLRQVKRAKNEALIVFLGRLCARYKILTGANPSSNEAAAVLFPILLQHCEPDEFCAISNVHTTNQKPLTLTAIITEIGKINQIRPTGGRRRAAKRSPFI